MENQSVTDFLLLGQFPAPQLEPQTPPFLSVIWDNQSTDLAGVADSCICHAHLHISI